MIGGIDQQAIVAERLENGRGLRRRLGRQLADRRRGLRKFVVEKLGQRVVDGVGAGRGREHEQRENPERANRAEMSAASETKSGEMTGVQGRHGSPLNRSGRLRLFLIGQSSPREASASQMGRMGAQ